MLLLGGHFAEGARVAVGPEDGVVAKPGGSARGEDEVAVDAALEGLDPAVGPGKRERADEMRPPGRRRAGGAQFRLDAAHRVAKVFLLTHHPQLALALCMALA